MRMRKAHHIAHITSHRRAACRLIAVIVWVAVLLLPCLLLRACRANTFLHSILQIGYKGILRLSAIRVSVCGEAPVKASQGVMLVGNHVSYLDIAVLGALFPCRFIAKSEVASWPVVGLFAKIQHSIFVDRDKHRRLTTTQAQIESRLTDGYPYILFAEGTSGDGTRILPFRSSLLQTAVGMESAIYVQGFCLQYSAYGGLPVGRYHRPLFGWYGDMELASHVWRLLGLPSSQVNIRFTEPLIAEHARNRKELTRTLQKRVEQALEDMRAL